MEVYCTAPYWKKVGGGQGEDKFEDTQLFISKIYGLWAEVNRRSGDGRCGNWSSATILLKIAPCYIPPRWRKPRGPISNPTSAVGRAICQLWLLYLFRVLEAAGENSKRDIILRRWLRAVCYLHASPPGPWIQRNYARQAGQGGALKGTPWKEDLCQPISLHYCAEECMSIILFIYFFCSLVK